METTAGLTNSSLKGLLICGILAALLFVGTDLITGLLKPGYRFDSQSGSVLSAFGTTTRPYVLPLNIAANILLIAFAGAVWLSADRNWALRVTAALLAGNAVSAMIAEIWFPWHLDEAVNAYANRMNVIFMGTSVVLFFLAICFGAAANHSCLLYCTIGMILMWFVAGHWATAGTKFARGGAQGPLVGVQERTMMYGEMLWLALQAVILLRA